MPNNEQTHDLTVTRVFDAPINDVWHAWSDGAHVQQWWGPHGWTSPVCNMNFHEGGKTLVSMRAPAEMGGFDMYNTWTYTEIIPTERIEFTHNFSDANGNKLDPAAIGLPPDIPADVPHIITLRALTPTQTELTVTEKGYGSAETAAFSKSGLEECLDKMAASFNPESTGTH